MGLLGIYAVAWLKKRVGMDRWDSTVACKLNAQCLLPGHAPGTPKNRGEAMVQVFKTWKSDDCL